MNKKVPHNIHHFFLNDPPRGGWERLGNEIQHYTDIQVQQESDSKQASYELCFFFNGFYREECAFPNDPGKRKPIDYQEFKVQGVDPDSGSGIEVSEPKYDDVDAQDIEDGVTKLLDAIKSGTEADVPMRFVRYLKKLGEEEGFDFNFLDRSQVKSSQQGRSAPVGPKDIKRATYHASNKELNVMRVDGTKESFPLKACRIVFFDALMQAKPGYPVPPDHNCNGVKAASVAKWLRGKGLSSLVRQHQGGYIKTDLLRKARR